jgi:hypothetical protein
LIFLLFPAGFFFFNFVSLIQFSRGNQREKDRERAQARGGNKVNKGKDDGLTHEQRRERLIGSSNCFYIFLNLVLVKFQDFLHLFL